MIRKSLVEGGRIKEIVSTKGGLKFKIINQSEAVNLKALIDRVYSDIPGFEEIMEAAYGQWNNYIRANSRRPKIYWRNSLPII